MTAWRNVCVDRSRTPSRWRAQLYEVATRRWRWRILFPRTDRLARTPELADSAELREAWDRVRRGVQPTKKHAVLRAEELAQTARNHAGLKLGEKTLRDLVELELGHPGVRKGRPRSASTMAAIRRELIAFADWLDDAHPTVELLAIREEHIEEYADALRSGMLPNRKKALSEGSVANAVTYLHRMFELGIGRKYLATNPCRGVRTYRPSMQNREAQLEERSLTEAQVSKLVKACANPYTTGGRTVGQPKEDGKPVERFKVAPGARLSVTRQPPSWLRPFVVVSIGTACRVGELLRTRFKVPGVKEYHESVGLRWRDIDWDQGLVRVWGKTGSRRVGLPDHCAAELEEYRRVQIESGILSDLIFLTDDGRPLRNPAKAFQTALKRAGLPHRRIHDLRHTALSLLATENAPPAVIQQQAGHTTPAMTNHYIRVEERRLAEEVRAAHERRAKRTERRDADEKTA